MLTHPTLDQLRALKLDGMVQAFIELAAQEEVRNLAHAEWLALLLDREAADRNTRRFQTRLRAARLRHSQAAIEDVAILDRIVHNAYRIQLDGPAGFAKTKPESRMSRSWIVLFTTRTGSNSTARRCARSKPARRRSRQRRPWRRSRPIGATPTWWTLTCPSTSIRFRTAS